MAVNLSPIGGVAAQFLDNSGNPLTGGKIYTYSAGTTTPQATYTTANGNIPLANPIILDAAGRVPTGEIWLTDGLQYKFVIKTSTDVQIGSYDNIIGINSNFVNYTNSQEIQTATAGQTVFTLTTMQYQPGTNSLSVFVDGVNQYGPGASYAYEETSSTVITFNSGLPAGAEVKFTASSINASSYGDASQISYLPPFANGVTTNVETKLSEYISVKDFGAVGDGVADDTAAIQAAITALGVLTSNNSNASSLIVLTVGGGKLFFPKGKYKVTSPLRYSGGMIWEGENWGTNIIYTPASSSSCVEENTSAKTWTNTQEGFIVKNIAFTAGNANAAFGLKLTNTQGITLDNVTISGFSTTNLYIGGTGGGGYYNILNNVQLLDAPLNLHIDGSSLNSGGDTTIIGGFLHHSVSYTPPQYSAIIRATGVTFIGTSLEGRATVAQVLSQSIGLRFVNAYYEDTNVPLVKSDYANGLAGNVMIEGAQATTLALTNFPTTTNDTNAFEQYIPVSYFRGMPRHVPLVQNGNFRYGLLGWARNNSGGTYGNGLVYFEPTTFGNSYGGLRYEAAGTGNFYIRASQTIPAAALKKYAGGTQRVYFHVIAKLENASDSQFQLNCTGAGLGNKFSTRTDMMWGASNEYRLYTIGYTLYDGTANLSLVIDFISETAGRKGWIYGVWSTIGGLDYMSLPSEDIFPLNASPSPFDYATWNVGDKIENSEWALGEPVGWICKTAGTNGTALSGVTAATTSGLLAVTFSSVLNLGVGMYITIAGVTGTKKIASLSGLNGTLDTAADATVAAGAVAYSNAAFASLYTPV